MMQLSTYFLFLLIFWGSTQQALSQEISSLEEALQHRVIEADLPWQEVQDFTESRVLPMPQVTSVNTWESYIEGRRAAVLKDVIFRGEAANWRDADKQVEWLETIEGGPGYSIQKLRYEAIPGLWIPALLYLPDQLTGKVPVVLNVNGHDSKGNATDYKQIRCINQAKRGMLALSVEWMGMGQLRGDGFNHYRSNQIDLCGTSGLATHYLYMTRGLDILLEHPNADLNRVAVAGLSGGGWQSIFISSLDKRVTLSNPVAGYSSYTTRARYISDLGDSEQTPVDLAMTADYNHLTAMRAPRPTLLTFNAEDKCCYNANHALEPLINASQPIFDLYGKSENLRSHVNTDPGSHNYEVDNRQQFYKMLGDHFFTEDESYSADEIPSDAELKTAEELHVELPEENLDFHKIALRLMEDLPALHALAIESQRASLSKVLRLPEYQVQPVQIVDLNIDGLTAKTWRLRLNSEWTVPATELVPDGNVKSTVILLADTGRGTAAETAQRLLQAGHRVLAIDPFYFGESTISKRDFLYGLLVASVGERSLGIQAAQVAAVGNWAKTEFNTDLQIQAIGQRTSLIGLVTAALNPNLFKSAKLNDGMSSLKDVITQDLNVSQAPELFTFGLLEAIDIPGLRSLALPCEIVD